jgi:hypothetical protein
VGEWEFIIVDNASDPGREPKVGLGWHPHARVLNEPLPGKINALISAIQASQASLLVLVDDDNVLASDYLRKAYEIHVSRPDLAVFGGSILPHFEVEPPEGSTPFLPHLALYKVERAVWCNKPTPGHFVAGAGMCLTSAMARVWVNEIRRDSWMLTLGAPVTIRPSAEDEYIGLLACRRHEGLGRFPELSLTHLIPSDRLNMEYLRRLVFSNKFNSHLFRLKTGQTSVSMYRLFRWILGLWRLWLGGCQHSYGAQVLSADIQSSIYYLRRR